MAKCAIRARPDETVDAVVVSGLLIMAVQTLVSREINPAYPSVVTISKVVLCSASLREVISKNECMRSRTG